MTGAQGSRWVSSRGREISRKPADERWADILNVSARMFAEQGYAATSLQHIAEELGILKGSLYYYIASKDDLLYEVIRTVYAAGVASFQAAAAADGPVLDRLRAAISGHVGYLIDNITATTVYLHEYDRLSKERRAALNEFDYADALRRLILEGQGDGTLRTDLDATVASLAALGAANWVYRWYREGSVDPQAIAHQMAEITVSGLSAR